MVCYASLLVCIAFGIWAGRKFNLVIFHRRLAPKTKNSFFLFDLHIGLREPPLLDLPVDQEFGDVLGRADIFCHIFFPLVSGAFSMISPMFSLMSPTSLIFL